MQQQNKASAQPHQVSAVAAQKEWHSSEIAAPDPCNSGKNRISGKQVYLKDKPQALILLQAAEIERLNAYLKDYKCKYRVLSREPLDRQSYEIQIKELFERDAASKAEIDRLSQLLATTNASAELYQQQLFSAQEKYRLAVAERDAVGERNIALQRELQNTRDNFDRYIKKSSAEVHSLNSQLDSHKTYTDSVLKNNKDLVAKVNTIPQYERRIVELETQLTFYLEQAHRLNKEIQTKTEKLINQERGYSTLFEGHKNLQNSHQDLKNELSSQLKAVEESKVLASQLRSESDKVKALHDVNVRDSTLVLAKRNEDIDSLTKQLVDFSLKSDAEQKDCEALRRRVASLQEKYALSLQEEAKQSEAIRQQQQEIGRYESGIALLQQSQAKREAEWQSALETQQSELKTRSAQLLQNHQKDVEQYGEIIAKKEREAEELTKANHDLERAVHTSRGQLKLAQQIIKAQEAENQQLKRQEQQLQSASSERDSLARAIKEKNATIAQLEKTLRQEREKQAELAAKNSKLLEEHADLKRRFAEENISLNRMINSKVSESESLKKQLVHNEQDLKTQFESSLQAQDEAHALKIAKLHKQKQAIIEGLRSEHAHLKTQHAQMEQSKSQAQSRQAELSTEYKSLQAKNDELQKSIEQHALKIAELTKIGDLLKVHYDQASSNNQKLLQRLNQKETLLLTSQNKKQMQKQELLTLRGKTIRFTAEKACYDMEIYELKQETKRLNTGSAEMRQQTAQQQSQIAKLKAEREQLSSLLQGKTRESEGLKMKMIELQSELKQSFESALKEKEESHNKAYQLLSADYSSISKKVSVYQCTLENVRSQLVAIQLMTGQLKQERALLIKKNGILVRSIRTLSNELDTLEKEGDSIAAFFTKDSAIHKQLTSRFTSLQDLLNQLQSQKIIVEENNTATHS